MESLADYPLTTKKQIHAIVQSHAILTDRSKSHRTSSRLSMLFVLLGVCVFVWGLGYKLSLYETQTSSIHRIPEAKLLTRTNEDRNLADGGWLSHPKSPSLEQVRVYTFILAITLLTTVGACASVERRHAYLPRLWHLRLGAFQSEFFLRPPPAASISL